MKQYGCGLDIGSRTSKIVLYDAASDHIDYFNIVDTGAIPKNTAQKLYSEMVQQLELTAPISVISTGYGRDQVDFAKKAVTEITCHAVGVSHLFPETSTIVDIGGQDSKAIKLKDGSVVDFYMNDKCAAGTGRFLEVVADILELPKEEMYQIYLESSKPASISSMCVVFAESEIISMLASGVGRADIFAGVLDALARRTLSMVNRLGIQYPFVFTGGVARNRAMVEVIGKKLQQPPIVPEQPSITGALGAAVLAAKKNR